MSQWIEVKDIDDVSVSADSKDLHLYVGSDDFGGNYITVPMEFIRNAIKLAEPPEEAGR